MAERVKEQEFEEGFLHGWDGSECIYYTDEKCLYYNDAEAPCHHCHHYTRKTQQKRERIAENYLETRNKVIENCWRMIVGNDTPKQEDGWLEVMNDRQTENGIANIYNFMYKGERVMTLEEVQGYGANRYFISSGEYTLADYMRAVQNKRPEAPDTGIAKVEITDEDWKTAIAQHKQSITAGAKVKITGKLQNLYGDFLTVEYNGTRYTVDPRKVTVEDIPDTIGK